MQPLGLAGKPRVADLLLDVVESADEPQAVTRPLRIRFREVSGRPPPIRHPLATLIGAVAAATATDSVSLCFM